MTAIKDTLLTPIIKENPLRSGGHLFFTGDTGNVYCTVFGDCIF